MKFTAKKARKRRKNTRKRFKGGTPKDLPPLPLALIEFEKLAKQIKDLKPELNFQEGDGQSYAGHLVFHIMNEHNKIDLQHLGHYIEDTYKVQPKVSFLKKWFKKTPPETQGPPPPPLFPLSNPMIYGDFVYKITGVRSKTLWARPRTLNDTPKHIFTLVKTFIETKRDPVNIYKSIDPDPNSEYEKILYIDGDDY
jgi:hypothetical protein